MNSTPNATHNAAPDGTQLRPAPEPVAPGWHTAVLIIILLGFSYLAASSQRAATAHRGRIVLYASTIVWEWLLLGFVVFGIRRRGLQIRELIQGRWSSPAEFMRDLFISAGFWLIAMFVLAGVGYALGLASANAAAEAKEKLGFIVPQSRFELALFLGLSATAGFCEEVIFRGYLQRQFTALAGSEIAGVVLQALIFGAGHGYEGGARMLLIAVFGVMFGLLAMWRKSLRPGMLAHGPHDGLEGILLKNSHLFQ